jgi:hypothetical protein
MTTLIKKLEKLCVTRKTLRAEAIEILRDMSKDDIVILEREGPQKKRLAWKLRHYPGDLSEQRLMDLLKKKEELGL